MDLESGNFLTALLTVRCVGGAKINNNSLSHFRDQKNLAFVADQFAARMTTERSSECCTFTDQTFTPTFYLFFFRYKWFITIWNLILDAHVHSHNSGAGWNFCTKANFTMNASNLPTRVWVTPCAGGWPGVRAGGQWVWPRMSSLMTGPPCWPPATPTGESPNASCFNTFMSDYRRQTFILTLHLSYYICWLFQSPDQKTKGWCTVRDPGMDKNKERNCARFDTLKN